MAKRLQDLEKESRHFRGSPWWVYLTWLGIRKEADGFGLLPESPIDIGSAFMAHALDKGWVSVKRIGETIESFTWGCDPMVVRYDYDGQPYLAMRKYQNYQRTRLPGESKCPCPDLETLRQLTPETATLITENLQKFSAYCSPEICNMGPAVAVAVAVTDKDSPASGGKASPPAGCSLCRKPTKSLLQRLHDQFNEVRYGQARSPEGECVLIVPARDNGRLKSLLDAGRTAERIEQVWEFALRQRPPDRYLEEKGWIIPAFVYQFAALERACGGGKRAAAGKPAKRGPLVDPPSPTKRAPTEKPAAKGGKS